MRKNNVQKKVGYYIMNASVYGKVLVQTAKVEKYTVLKIYFDFCFNSSDVFSSSTKPSCPHYLLRQWSR